MKLPGRIAIRTPYPSLAVWSMISSTYYAVQSTILCNNSNDTRPFMYFSFPPNSRINNNDNHLVKSFPVCKEVGKSLMYQTNP